jgi:hypothetical protein
MLRDEVEKFLMIKVTLNAEISKTHFFLKSISEPDLRFFGAKPETDP